MDGWNWNAIGTVAALALGLVNLYLGYVRTIRRERAAARRAQLEVRREHYWRRDIGKMQERLAVRNHGPHTADDLDIVSLRDADGGTVDHEGGAVNPVRPVSSLRPLQEHHTIFEWSMDDKSPVAVTLRWTDSDGMHEEPFALSPHYT